MYTDHPQVQRLAEGIHSANGEKFRIRGMAGSLPAFMIAALFRLSHRNTLVVLNDREDALYFMNDLQALMPRKEILWFPSTGKRPYQLEDIDNANVLQRAEVLNQLNHTQAGRQLIITFAEALTAKVINRKSLVRNTLEVRKGEACGMDFITDVLDTYHFTRVDFVSEPGHYAMRGGILDVYSFANEFPYRLEFLGDEIESIRTFDPVSQLSTGETHHISLIPNVQQHLVKEEQVTFLEYMSENTTVFLQGVDFVKGELDKLMEKAVAHYAGLQKASGGGTIVSDPQDIFFSGELFLQQLKSFNTVEFGSSGHYRQHREVLEWKSAPQPAFKKEFKLLAEHLKGNTALGMKNFFLSENEKQIRRLEEIFKEVDPAVQFEGVKQEIHAGFTDQVLRLVCYTDHEVFERYHRYKSSSGATRSQALTLKELRELQPGDYVTHVQHGIGKFGGLQKIKVGENVQEAVRIVYRDGDEIFVNVNSLYKIAKYSGKEGAEPALSKLGSAEWGRAKARTKTRLKELAFDLIALYARRKATQGHAYSADSYMQQELEASFLYEDTPDQLTCTEDVKADMEAPAPMDRLICGDVGFGKTEIAVRAAFKAALDGKQTVVLVPTTILALQHFKTFSERLAKFPITVDYLNRFRTAKETKEILNRLAEGKIDIIIGTHRLVSTDVKFKDLGLLIIDEEHKFGVSVKEKLKNLKVNVDSLALTATPIPRTLQFSLMGVRDLSTLATPPPNRQPVETSVVTFDQGIIRDAVAYELKRGGQVFFVHNRIEDLDEIGSMIRKLVPDARISIAHGQMPGPKMEEVMTRFIEGGTDVLVCTTIIESGLDIPNANTIIIDQAHMYGLSDLHQMRGRVGRSNRKAHCLLLAPHESLLSRDAKKRLKAIEEFSDIGSGFHISLRDLDIRGAGDLFGPEQSGFLNELGSDMYHRILEEALIELKEEHFSDLFAEEIDKKRADYVDDTQVETDLNILIPERYIPGISERLNFYNRIAAAQGEDDLRKISAEMIDRFGVIPPQVLGLFDTVRIRTLGRQLGLEKVLLTQKMLRLFFPGDKTSRFYQSEIFGRVIEWVQREKGRAKLKETPKNLSLNIEKVETIKDVFARVRELYDFALVKENAYE